MAVYRRGDVYWYSFIFAGRRIRATRLYRVATNNEKAASVGGLKCWC